MGRISVCLIDDDSIFCDLVRRALERTGKYEVQVFLDAREGLARVQSNPPHILLLDITMPNLDGLEILKRLKGSETTSHVPVVIVTGHEEEEYIEKAVYNYAEQYLIKPFDSVYLLNVLDRVLSAGKPTSSDS